MVHNSVPPMVVAHNSSGDRLGLEPDFSLRSNGGGLVDTALLGYSRFRNGWFCYPRAGARSDPRNSTIVLGRA